MKFAVKLLFVSTILILQEENVIASRKIDTESAPKGHSFVKLTKKVRKQGRRMIKSETSCLNFNTILLSPGESIQDALDNAPENTNIRLRPGDYIEEGNSDYGLRIAKNCIRLIGSIHRNKRTRILHSGEQQVGVYAAPPGCEFLANECNSTLTGFSIIRIDVENFQNGIQTRFVDGFEFLNCKSINNLNNGLYPTYSKNGIIQGCVSTGSLDAAIWVAGSRKVQVLNNDVSESVTGIEITVSKDLYIANNNVFNNVVGIGMYHANMAGTLPDFPPYNNCVIENNDVYDNNKENNAPDGSFQASILSGIGILLIGVRGETIRENRVEGHVIGGVMFFGFCTVQQLFFQVDCVGSNAPIDGDPPVNDNTVIGNKFERNGEVGIPDLDIPGADIFYLQSEEELLMKPNENCFKDNTSPDGKPASFFATDFVSPILLPTGGCQ